MLLAFVRRGWENRDGSNRSTLQKVEYLVSGDQLQRRAYPHVDGAAAGNPVAVIGGVRQLRLRYRDREGQWRDRWDPLRIGEMPRALELVIDVESTGSIRQLFLVGAGQ